MTLAFSLQGLIAADARGDLEGHRYYDTKWRVRSTNSTDHGAQALATAGLPLVGSTYALDNDSDDDAFCRPEWVAKREYSDPAKPNWYIVSIPFSTKPMLRCQDARPGDPLLEPLRKGLTSKSETVEATHDRNGDKLVMSTFEAIRGDLVRLARQGGLQAWVEGNVATIDYDTIAALEHHVNDATMWGLAARKIEFDSWSATNEYYGVCFEYFKLRLVFNINWNTFDAIIPDEGRKVWDGVGPKTDPASYVQAKDLRDENTTIQLNLAGEPWDGETPADNSHVKELHKQGDLSALGVASAF